MQRYITFIASIGREQGGEMTISNSGLTRNTVLQSWQPRPGSTFTAELYAKDFAPDLQWADASKKCKITIEIED